MTSEIESIKGYLYTLLDENEREKPQWRLLSFSGVVIHHWLVQEIMKDSVAEQLDYLNLNCIWYKVKKLIFPICYPGTSAESSCGEEKACPKSTATTPATTPDSGKPPLANSSSKANEKSDARPERTPAIQDPMTDRVEIGRIPVLKEPINSTAKQQLNSETSSSCGSCGSNNVSDQNFVKAKSSSTKKRKKRQQNKNKVSNNNSCDPAAAAPEPVKSVQVSNSERTCSPQNRFSSKSGRSKPNR